jgi:hypothetical protein
MRGMLITMYGMLALSMGALFGLAIYLGYRAGYAKARRTQAEAVEEGLYQMLCIRILPPANCWPIVGTELGRKFQEHLKREKEAHAISESEAKGKDRSEEGPGGG